MGQPIYIKEQADLMALFNALRGISAAEFFDLGFDSDSWQVWKADPLGFFASHRALYGTSREEGEFRQAKLFDLVMRRANKWTTEKRAERRQRLL
jgi:hypothetical protein